MLESSKAYISTCSSDESASNSTECSAQFDDVSFCNGDNNGLWTSSEASGDSSSPDLLSYPVFWVSPVKQEPSSSPEIKQDNSPPPTDGFMMMMKSERLSDSDVVADDEWNQTSMEPFFGPVQTEGQLLASSSSFFQQPQLPLPNSVVRGEHMVLQQQQQQQPRPFVTGVATGCQQTSFPNGSVCTTTTTTTPQNSTTNSNDLFLQMVQNNGVSGCPTDELEKKIKLEAATAVASSTSTSCSSSSRQQKGYRQAKLAENSPPLPPDLELPAILGGKLPPRDFKASGKRKHVFTERELRRRRKRGLPDDSDSESEERRLVRLPRRSLLTITTAQMSHFVSFMRSTVNLTPSQEDELSRQKRLVKNRECACRFRAKKELTLIEYRERLTELEDDVITLRAENEQLRRALKEATSHGGQQVNSSS